MTRWYVMCPATEFSPTTYINADGSVEEDVACVETFMNKADADSLAEDHGGLVVEDNEIRPEDLDGRLAGESWDEDHEDPFEGMTDEQVEQSVHRDED